MREDVESLSVSGCRNDSDSLAFDYPIVAVSNFINA